MEEKPDDSKKKGFEIKESDQSKVFDNIMKMKQKIDSVNSNEESKKKKKKGK